MVNIIVSRTKVKMWHLKTKLAQMGNPVDGTLSVFRVTVVSTFICLLEDFPCSDFMSCTSNNAMVVLLHKNEDQCKYIVISLFPAVGKLLDSFFTK